MDNNIKVLRKINKGCIMAMVSISFIYKNSNEEVFNNELESEYKEYEKISKNSIKLLEKYFKSNDKTDICIFEKMMIWYSIKGKTLLNNSVSKLSEIMLNGCNMGIISGRKLLNDNSLNKEVLQILNKFIKLQEENVENLKKYL